MPAAPGLLNSLCTELGFPQGLSLLVQALSGVKSGVMKENRSGDAIPILTHTY